MKKFIITSLSVVVILCLIVTAVYVLAANDVICGISGIKVHNDKIVITQGFGGSGIGGVLGYSVSTKADDTVIYDGERPKSAEFLGENLVSVKLTTYTNKRAFLPSFYEKFRTVNKLQDYNVIVTNIPDDSMYMIVIGTDKDIVFEEKDYQKIHMFQKLTIEIAS